LQFPSGEILPKEGKWGKAKTWASGAITSSATGHFMHTLGVGIMITLERPDLAGKHRM
jgi:hypothetical protein